MLYQVLSQLATFSMKRFSNNAFLIIEVFFLDIHVALAILTQTLP